MKKIILKVVRDDKNPLYYKLEMNKDFLSPYEYQRTVLTKTLALVLRELEDCTTKALGKHDIDNCIKEAKEIAGIWW